MSSLAEFTWNIKMGRISFAKELLEEVLAGEDPGEHQHLVKEVRQVVTSLSTWSLKRLSPGSRQELVTMLRTLHCTVDAAALQFACIKICNDPLPDATRYDLAQTLLSCSKPSNALECICISIKMSPTVPTIPIHRWYALKAEALNHLEKTSNKKSEYRAKAAELTGARYLG